MVEDRSNVDELLQRLEELQRYSVKVGVLSKVGGELLMIANVQEFGAAIPVTDKMRGFFRYQFGVSLRADTTVIKIPERSFIRSSFDSKQGDIYQSGEQLIDAVIEGNLSAMDFYNLLGQTCVNTIQSYIRDLSSPANSGLTVANKGSSSPLVDTGRLLGSIDYEVVSK